MHTRKLPLSNDLQELTSHGTTALPIAFYFYHMSDFFNGRVPWHWHEELEFLRAEDFSLICTANGRQYCLNPGEAALFNRNTLHSIAAADGHSGAETAIVFHPKIIYGYSGSILETKYVEPFLSCRDLDCIVFSSAVTWQKQILSMFEEAFCLNTRREDGFEIKIFCLLNEIWTLLYENCRDVIEKNTKPSFPESDRTKLLLSYIHDNYQKPLTVDALASYAHISKRECFRCFKSELGVTPNSYLVQYRIRIALKLLTETSKNIAEISYETGFQDASYFCKTFKELMGCTPKEYRAAPDSIRFSQIRS